MFQTIFLPHQHGRSALDTSRTLFLLASTQGVSCRLVMNHLINMYMFSLIPPPPPPPHIYVSKCMYVHVHISLFLPECACTTIIDISPRIFKLIYCILLLCINHNCYLYCCCVSIIIVICICPPGALIWLINLFYSILFYSSPASGAAFNFFLNSNNFDVLTRGLRLTLSLLTCISTF